MSERQPRMVKLCDLWQRKSAKGTVYFSGYMGDCQVLLFKEGKKPHPTRADEEVIVWKLLVQERDPNRRPQRQERAQDRAARADEQGTAAETRSPPAPARTPGGAITDAIPRDRDRGDWTADPGQHDTGDPQRPFDDEVPF